MTERLTNHGKPEMESLSETRKSGRPRSNVRRYADTLDAGGLGAEGCERTRRDYGFFMLCLSALTHADEDTQRAIVGCTLAEMAAGAGALPKGCKTAGVEAGRYMDATGADAADVVRMLSDARKRKVSWGDIAAHFRSLRLGEREGNAWALFKGLARTVDEYRRRFPKTAREQVRTAVVDLLEALDATEAGGPDR